MHVTVVHAHPSPSSFSHGLLDVTREALSRHDLDLCDLYADDFNPVMTASAHREYLGDRPIQDPLVQHYADCVVRADALVFVYPTWHSGVPAMMKGWFEKVLVNGVAFGFDDKDRIRPRMGHIKRIAGVTTYGSSRLAVALSTDGGRRTVQRALRVSTGLRTKSTWLGLYGMDSTTDAQRTVFVDRVRREFEQW